jgi:hypothetical protein
MQCPHVAGQARDAEQAAAVVDQVFHASCIELFFAYQVRERTGVEVAASRAHDQPAGGCQAHAGVDRLAVQHSGDAGAVAQVRNQQARGQCAGELMHDGFTRQAVKAIALNSLGAQRARQGQHAGDVGHPGMESGVEARCLGQAGEVRHRLVDGDQRGGRVQRGERSGSFQALQHDLIDPAVFAQTRPAVHDAVPDRLRCGPRATGEQVGDAADRIAVIEQGGVVIQQLPALCIRGSNAGRLAAHGLRLATQQAGHR